MAKRKNSSKTDVADQTKSRTRSRKSEGTEKFPAEKKKHIPLLGKTHNQEVYIRSMFDNTLTIARGVAGSGKSYLATAFACKGLVDRRFENIILSRSNIPTGGRTLGHFPGTIEDKLTPWLAQLLNYMNEFVNQSVVECWKRKKQVQLLPLETARGRSFSNSCVIVDECQNLNLEEIKCLSTRIGEGSKLILCGDGSQSDLRIPDFDRFSDMLIKHQIVGTSVITFGIEDCLRSGLTSEMLKMFEAERI